MKVLVVNTTDDSNITAEFEKIIKERCPDMEKVSSFYSNESEEAIQIIEAGNLEIKPCVGCNFCWLKTPGICSVKDDYTDIFKEYLKADKLFFITDNVFGFVSPKCKNAVDRLIPVATMYLKFKNKEMRHVARYDNVADIGFIYTGDGDRDYLTRWCSRINVNFETKSLGAYHHTQIKEAVACM